MMVCDVCGLSWDGCDAANAELLTRQCAGSAAREEDRLARLESLRRARAAGEVDGYERGARETSAMLADLTAAAAAWVAADDAFGRAVTKDERSELDFARWKAAEALRTALAKVPA